MNFEHNQRLSLIDGLLAEQLGEHNMDGDKLYQLIESATKGNRAALEELCVLYGRRVTYVCLRYMGNQHDAEDAAQEVFIELQKGITKLQNPQAFTVWLQRLIVRTCSDMRRRGMKNNYNMTLDDLDDVLREDNLEYIPQEYVEKDEHRKELIEIINSLPRNQRACVVLYYFENLSYADIAQVLNIAQPSVSTNLQRAKKRIHDEIQRRHPKAYQKPLLPMQALALVLQKDAEAQLSTTLIETIVGASLAQGAQLTAAAGGAALAQGGIINGVVAALGGTTLLAVSAYMVVNLVSGGTGAESQPVDTWQPTVQVTEPASEQAPGHPVEESESSYWQVEDASQSQSMVVRVSSDENSGNSQRQVVGGTPYAAMQVTGRVAVDESALPAGRKPPWLEGMVLTLADSTGRALGTSSTDAEGNFVFTNPAVGTQVAATVKIDGPLPAGYVAAQPKIEVVLQPGVSKELDTVLLVPSQEALIEVWLQGGMCDCGHINPEAAEIYTQGTGQLAVSWAITTPDGTQVANGTTQEELTQALTALHLRPAGAYRLTARVQDAQEETAQYEIDIDIWQ